MWFTKQGPALAYHDSRADHIVVAEDISAQGHKRYGVFPRTEIDNFTGPYCELIRVHSKCRLYFDLDGSPDTPKSVVGEVVALVQARLFALYGIEANPLVLCSSNVSKFSKHLIFPDVVFLNNWEHMHNFVSQIQHDRIDYSVYSRNRCFRMAGCCKYGDETRVFTPGLPSSALIQVESENSLECGKSASLKERVSGKGVPVGMFNGGNLHVPENWKTPLQGLEPDDLLLAIHPNQCYQAFFAIGCAYKRVGGGLDMFVDWCKEYRQRARVERQWRGWNRNKKGYGFPFLKQLALHSSSTDECSVHLNEAFGFHPTKNITHFNAPYLNYKQLMCTERCVLAKSPTGSGKSTAARELAQEYSHKRILYLVSSRPLAYCARNSLNAMVRLGRALDFVSYLETDKPLHTYKHLVCSVQSIWRAFRLDRKAYSLIIVDEMSSVIEDMTNVTNKRPKENQEALRWFAEHCDKFVGLDAHLMDTALVLCEDYFTDYRVLINHHRCERKNAIFIPLPKYNNQLKNIRAKALVPTATEKQVAAFSDAACLYDLLFQCWSNQIKTYFVCNNVRLGNFVEENYLRRSYTWMALLWAGFCDDVSSLITDFCCKEGIKMRYAWIHSRDGRTGKDFGTLDWWSKIDHLQYTLKVCQGLDYNPENPHYGVGFCYTTPNTCVPRRALQQTGRVRKLAKNPLHEHPTVYFAISDRVMVKHLPVFGRKRIEEYAQQQEYFMKAVVKHHSVKVENYFDWMFKPEPVWRKLYIMVMNERETYLRYPKESFAYWLRHDGWTMSTITTRPKPVCLKQNFRTVTDTAYKDIPAMEDLEYRWMSKRRNPDAMQTRRLKKYKFGKTFKTGTFFDEALWDIFTNHPGWVRNTRLERFSDFEDVISRRFNQFVQTQNNSEWMDTTGAKLIIIQKITKRLGLETLWSSNGELIAPGCFARAEAFVEKNKQQILLAFGWAGDVKRILKHWGGHTLKLEKKVNNATTTHSVLEPPAPMGECVESAMHVPGSNVHVLREDDRLRQSGRTPTLVDAAIRKIKGPPWHLLRHPN
ncbi:TPA: hypothetical protein EYO57_02225 [Candidatus Poribacteria bacterium]|nr:hypothetical protein [Candidatus Poribacteria bacterium]